MDYVSFIEGLNKQPFNGDKIDKIKALYSVELPSQVESVVSALDETLFFENDSFVRLLSLQEVLEAETDMNVELVYNGILPLFDLGDNDYLSFDFTKGMWCKFNIVDELGFSYKSSLTEYTF